MKPLSIDGLKVLSLQGTDMIYSHDEFEQQLPAKFPIFLERCSNHIKHILQDLGQWTDNIAHEKLLLRLSFDLVEQFLEYCPSQIPCRPDLILDGFVSDFFAKPQASNGEAPSSLKRLLSGMLNRAVISRDGLICLFYHFYGMKPVEVGAFLGLEEGQTQRIYKNFARWRKNGWAQGMQEIGLSMTQVNSLEKQSRTNTEKFNDQALQILENLLPFYRKSEPPYYPCLIEEKWWEMVRENYGFDYRMWHLPLCFPCMQIIANGEDPGFPQTPLKLNLHIIPYSLKDEAYPVGIPA